MKSAGIVLAAGSSTRMGRDKLALPLADGGSLAARVVQAAAASQLDTILVIGRTERPPIWLQTAQLQTAHGVQTAPERSRYIACPDADKGLAHSLRCGLQTAEALQYDAAMILLADQPFVRSEHINTLLERFASNRQVDYVAASDQGKAKPPVLLASSLFGRLQSLEGDQGAGALINGSSAQGIRISMHPVIFLDADTPEDFNFIRTKEAEGT
ncbi:nucleotidyltransferase family protein [Paenibacillus medicaginis]|uniref:NTP transferase domain-containing protein n=1 Tax=Paenibacillus medicaginis TaxID=1470560 RepID=A0ABV5BU38_9BACL